MAAPVRPRVFLDVAIGSQPAGPRIVIELFADRVPRTCENFRALCVGSADRAPSGAPLHYAPSLFHRVISDYLLQGGDITHGNGTGGHSIYGPHFPDECLGWRSIDCPGLVCMANRGPDTNNSQFFITLDAATHLDAKNVCFGQVVSGMETVRRIEEVAVDERDRPVEGQEVRIVKSGELEFRRAPAIPEKVSNPKRKARRSPNAMNISPRSRSRSRSRPRSPSPASRSPTTTPTPTPSRSPTPPTRGRNAHSRSLTPNPASATPTSIRRHILPSGTRRGRSPPPPCSNPVHTHHHNTTSTAASPSPRSASPTRSPPHVQKGSGSSTTHTHARRRRSRPGSRPRHHRHHRGHQRRKSTASRSRSRSRSRSHRHRHGERKQDRSPDRHTRRYDRYRHRSPSSEARIRREEDLREQGRLDDASMMKNSSFSSSSSVGGGAAGGGVDEPTVKFKGRGSMKYRERWGGGGGRRGGWGEYGRLG
ncbi:cyclophilin-like domain-containing protein [Tirmania nivea]|nr:cyclophilin-like domain-containing protein [Tirmania nivea]